MKKILPFIFPLVALLIVLFLGYRWYSARTERQGDISTFGEGVEIEDLTGADQQRIMRGGQNLKTVDLTGEGENMGEIRYEIVDGKVRFSVAGNLPEPTQGFYQVWVKKQGQENAQKAFALEYGKGGYMGSAALSEDNLPLEVIVSKEMVNDETMETVVLRGTIAK